MASDEKRKSRAGTAARAFAWWVARTPDKRLAALTGGPARGPLLGTIFRQMPRQLDRDAAQDVNTTIEWRIRRPEGDPDRWFVAIADGSARTGRTAEDPARVTLELDAVDFLRVAAGQAAGPELFMTGRLRVEGDLMFATRLPQLFRVPASPAS